MWHYLSAAAGSYHSKQTFQYILFQSLLITQKKKKYIKLLEMSGEHCKQTPWEQSSSTSLTYSFHRDGEYSYFPLPSPLAKKNKAENNMELY